MHYTMYLNYIHPLLSPSNSPFKNIQYSSSQLHVFLKNYNPNIQFTLSVYARVWGHPLGHGQPTLCHPIQTVAFPLSAGFNCQWLLSWELGLEASVLIYAEILTV